MGCLPLARAAAANNLLAALTPRQAPPAHVLREVEVDQPVEAGLVQRIVVLHHGPYSSGIHGGSEFFWLF